MQASVSESGSPPVPSHVPGLVGDEKDGKTVILPFTESDWESKTNGPSGFHEAETRLPEHEPIPNAAVLPSINIS